MEQIRSAGEARGVPASATLRRIDPNSDEGRRIAAELEAEMKGKPGTAIRPQQILDVMHEAVDMPLSAIAALLGVQVHSIRKQVRDLVSMGSLVMKKASNPATPNLYQRASAAPAAEQQQQELPGDGCGDCEPSWRQLYEMAARERDEALARASRAEGAIVAMERDAASGCDECEAGIRQGLEATLASLTEERDEARAQLAASEIEIARLTKAACRRAKEDVLGIEGIATEGIAPEKEAREEAERMRDEAIAACATQAAEAERLRSRLVKKHDDFERVNNARSEAEHQLESWRRRWQRAMADGFRSALADERDEALAKLEAERKARAAAERLCRELRGGRLVRLVRAVVAGAWR